MGDETQTPALKIISPDDDLSNLDTILHEANKQRYEMYKANPSLANKEALGRMFRRTGKAIKEIGSFAGNTIKYLVLWPKFIKNHVWDTEDAWKDEKGNYTADMDGFRTGVTTAFYGTGIMSSIGASSYGWYNYSNGNMGIVPTLALNIGVIGGATSLAYDGIRSWFNYEREQAIESLKVEPKTIDKENI